MEQGKSAAAIIISALFRFKREDAFFYSAAILLLLTAEAKIYSATGTAKILSTQDQLCFT
jgi:hypothetical protein